MLDEIPHTFLLASPEPALLAAIEPILLASPARVLVVLTAQAALAAMTASNPPTVTLLDVTLPGMDWGQLLASVRTGASSARIPIVLISDTVTQEATDRIADGAIDDLILRNAEPSYWQLRIDRLLRTLSTTAELESLQETSVLAAQTDHLTGVYNRETILALLFRETDRVQRMNGSLGMVLFDIDDFGQWNSRLGSDACDELLCQVVARTNKLLRSYDLFGRPGQDEFLIAMPGCTPSNAVMLAERIRLDVFGSPFKVAGESIRLSACFGISSSHGRAPVVVLREAEQALHTAKSAGSAFIRFFSDPVHPAAVQVLLLHPGACDELQPR